VAPPLPFTFAAATPLLDSVALRGVGEKSCLHSTGAKSKATQRQSRDDRGLLAPYSQEEGLTLAVWEPRERVKQSSNRGRKEDYCPYSDHAAGGNDLTGMPTA
jgi:hypothetical protein